MGSPCGNLRWPQLWVHQEGGRWQKRCFVGGRKCNREVLLTGWWGWPPAPKVSCIWGGWSSGSCFFLASSSPLRSTPQHQPRGQGQIRPRRRSGEPRPAVPSPRSDRPGPARMSVAGPPCWGCLALALLFLGPPPVCSLARPRCTAGPPVALFYHQNEKESKVCLCFLSFFLFSLSRKFFYPPPSAQIPLHPSTSANQRLLWCGVF